MLFTEFFYKILLYFITPLCKPVANTFYSPAKVTFEISIFSAQLTPKKYFSELKNYQNKMASVS